jgi:hypothetical protein
MNSRRLFPTLKFTGQMCGPNRMTPRRMCYERAEAGTEDWAEVYKWLSLAARQGHEGAKKFMTVLESKLMTPEQIAQGQKRAREFKPR